MELTYTKKLEILRNDVEEIISAMVFAKISRRCDALLDTEYCIVSVCANGKLIDENGYEYDYSIFSIDDLCAIADDLKGEGVWGQ